jgi:hypothetical protein
MLKAAMAYLLRFLALLLIVRLVLRFVVGVMRGMAGPAQPRTQPQMPAVDLVRDRVCNTFVPRASALSCRVLGHEEHFCSAACRDRALALAS